MSHRLTPTPGIRCRHRLPRLPRVPRVLRAQRPSRSGREECRPVAPIAPLLLPPPHPLPLRLRDRRWPAMRAGRRRLQPNTVVTRPPMLRLGRRCRWAPRRQSGGGPPAPGPRHQHMSQRRRPRGPSDRSRPPQRWAAGRCAQPAGEPPHRLLARPSAPRSTTCSTRRSTGCRHSLPTRSPTSSRAPSC